MHTRTASLTATVLILVLISGCASIVPVRFEQSNQLFLEQTIQALDLGTLVSSKVPETAKICLVSMESPETGDQPFVAEIEDQLLTALCAKGFTVLERDSDLIKRVIAEQSAPNYVWMRFPSDVVMSQKGSSAASASAGLFSSSFVGGYDQTTVKGMDADSVISCATQLAGADYVLSYRVLECGLIYRPGFERAHKTREGLLRLHVRMTDAKTGRLVYAGNVQSTKSDQVPALSVKPLANFYYSFYPSNLPVERGTKSSYREVPGKGQKLDKAATPK